MAIFVPKRTTGRSDLGRPVPKIPTGTKNSRRALRSRPEFLVLVGIFVPVPNHIWAKRPRRLTTTTNPDEPSRKIPTGEIPTFDKTRSFRNRNSHLLSLAVRVSSQTRRLLFLVCSMDSKNSRQQSEASNFPPKQEAEVWLLDSCFLSLGNPRARILVPCGSRFGAERQNKKKKTADAVALKNFLKRKEPFKAFRWKPCRKAFLGELSWDWPTWLWSG